jgi:hypothetical protein
MGLAHGGQRQKNFNFLRGIPAGGVDLLEPKAVSGAGGFASNDLACGSLANAGLFGVPSSARANWQGVDYSQIVLNPSAEPLQKYVVFTYDDYQSRQASELYPRPNNHIVSIREERCKLAKYYDAEHSSVPGYQPTPQEEQEFLRLQANLAVVEQTRLQP